MPAAFHGTLPGGIAPQAARQHANTAYHVVRLAQRLDPATLDTALARLRQDPAIASAEADALIQHTALPNDPRLGELWAFEAIAPGRWSANFAPAWERSQGYGVNVAVVDSGVLPHPDLGSISPAKGNVAEPGYTFISDCIMAGTCPIDTTWDKRTQAPFPGGEDRGDWCGPAETRLGLCYWPSGSSWHGTHVAGTLAAQGNNLLGVTGGAFRARIVPVRVLGKGGGYLSDIVGGILWAAGVHDTIANPNPSRIINLSLGGSISCPEYLQQAIDRAHQTGAVLVVAAGNYGGSTDYYSPASCRHVVTVAATGPDGMRTLYSNSGQAVALAAPGGIGPDGILSTLNTGYDVPDLSSAGWTYIRYTGTSMATPQVSAALALLFSLKPDLPSDEAVALLQQTATPFPVEGVTGWGAGILNAGAAVDRLLAQYPPACPLWVEGARYTAGNVVHFAGRNYTALQGHTAHPGSNWIPPVVPAIWQQGGTCATGG
ncbi:S8 family serine peptidase [Chitiniphilus purpureus]|uniref:S8 family serine peptidase n=1 Tax=Chitiniphilus purpureus TaxID=2981137 RepID=A0ABY6DRI9_9NEIS|nr:S8 family serine peptidase [Chitiniphilus sp. CD1]UXY16989.1 S8 family serine peptidase [Chitiniphilus sp. CD1]